ncbi:hypothetical protein [Herminiimonas aquatilis]|uniref:Phospholipase D-like protein n=1 Tax=Herminiimonas aquatilis TaxID=345342 RepID=A0ABW2J1N5_9BURK
MIYVVTIILVVIMALNVKATVHVVRDKLSEPKQRFIQISLVWLLPIAGAFMVFAVHRPEEKHSGKYSHEPENNVDPAHFVERDS